MSAFGAVVNVILTEMKAEISLFPFQFVGGIDSPSVNLFLHSGESR